MVLSWFFTAIILFSTLASLYTAQGSALSAAIAQGAQSGITVSISLAGSICLWSGVGRLLDRTGITQGVSRLLRPVTKRLFPHSEEDPALRRNICANISANLLGLGNAATPMGIRAVKGMTDPKYPTRATDEMCRLIVLNTASIQLIPANVAAIRSGLGCTAPFDILPAVWCSSLLSAGMGLLAATLLKRVWKHG